MISVSKRSMFRFAALLAALCLAACQSARITNPPAPAIAARWYLETNDVGAPAWVLPQSEIQVRVAAEPVLTEADISHVTVAQDELGRGLRFEITPVGVERLIKRTATTVGGRLVLVTNGKAVGLRRTQPAYPDGRIFMFVELPEGELQQLATDLNRRARSRTRIAK